MAFDRDAGETVGGKANGEGVSLPIAARRLAVLDDEIERLERARSYLHGALLCRFDHPASDCKLMGAEIDRRLELTETHS